MEDIDSNEFGTPIDVIRNNENTLKRTSCSTGKCNTTFNVNDFVQDLEQNLDNFENLDNSDVNEDPKPANNDFNNDKKERIKIEVATKPTVKASASLSYNKMMQKFLIDIKEPIIIVLLFILLNNKYLIRMINSIPYMDVYQYPSLILRGIILAVIIYLLRKLN